MRGVLYVLAFQCSLKFNNNNVQIQSGFLFSLLIKYVPVLHECGEFATLATNKFASMHSHESERQLTNVKAIKLTEAINNKYKSENITKHAKRNWKTIKDVLCCFASDACHHLRPHPQHHHRHHRHHRPSTLLWYNNFPRTRILSSFFTFGFNQ